MVKLTYKYDKKIKELEKNMRRQNIIDYALFVISPMTIFYLYYIYL